MVTVKTTFELTVKMAGFEFALLNKIDWTVEFVVTVTEAPATITTESPIAGTTPPDHVPGEFQLPPIAVVVRVAATLPLGPIKIRHIASCKTETNLYTASCKNGQRFQLMDTLESAQQIPGMSQHYLSQHCTTLRFRIARADCFKGLLLGLFGQFKNERRAFAWAVALGEQ